MAIRNIRVKGDEVLRKKCKPVESIGKRESVPGESHEVERPNYVKVKALNEKGEEFILEGEELLARAILHENDHLDGILYIDHVK